MRLSGDPQHSLLSPLELPNKVSTSPGSPIAHGVYLNALEHFR